MNIYARYFDHEAITQTFDQLIDFLTSLREIPITQELIEDLDEYVHGDSPYPKRYKVRPRIYFILIKTTANSMEEFKARRKENTEFAPAAPSYPQNYTPHREYRTPLHEGREGWYLGQLNFKRVLLIPGTQKFQYRDTVFSAYVRANSPLHCYTRIVEHLKSRQDVDPRSQFPSAKGSNYTYEYLGEVL